MSAIMPVLYGDAPETLPELPGPRDDGAELMLEGPVRPRKKRVITAARREQNRQAQRIFRQRQKVRQREQDAKAAQRRELRPRTESVVDAFSSSCTKESLMGLRPGERRHGNSVQSLGSDSSCSWPYPPVMDESSSPSTSTSTTENNTFSADFATGKSTTTNTNSGDPSCDQLVPRAKSPSICLTDPKANAIEFFPTTFFGAMLQNAFALGFNTDEFGSCNTYDISPFYRASRPDDDPAALLSSVISDLRNEPPANLRPTLTQVLIPHHTSLDLIPLPQLRDRAIMLSAAMPQIFNLWELKVDIYVNGGLAISKRSKKDNATLQPWERASWEAEPWFLRKWTMLIGEEREKLPQEGGGGLSG